ncbi:MAG: NAD(P)-dependent oxidoreductase [Epulopiscium sp.]|nr:NAD(P)-dependent oxidoreductase [Candidatus Epulonipiscium sp.]
MWTEERLESLLTTPSEGLIEDIKKIQGDIYILGAGGKMGPSLALLAKNACTAAGIDKKICAVSRFSNPSIAKELNQRGIETISMDLMAEGAIDSLPYVDNIIYMAAKKFGTKGNESETWATNVMLPSLVARKFKGSKIVVFSSGNLYPMVPIHSGGSIDDSPTAPIGDYAMSTLGRERIFEYAANEYNTKVLIYRLNYAIDLRYGVLSDLANKILNDEVIDLHSGNFNCIWQGYANEVAIRSLLFASSPATRLNITGPETVSVRYAAGLLGKYLGKAPKFMGIESDTAYLNNASKCFEIFGYPSVSLNQLIQWQAEWILDGGHQLNIPTHFEEREGNY